MAIFDTNGIVVTSACDIEATELDYAYDIEGNIVFTKGTPSYDYDNYNISDLFTLSASGLSGSSFQAFDIYNGIIAQVRHSSYLCLIDLATHEVINSGMFCNVQHGNSFSFSRQFYSDEDEFPLSYSTMGYKYIYINRVTRDECTLLKTYKTDPTGYGGYIMSICPTPNGKTMYTMGYTFEDYMSDRGGTNLIRIAKWNLENETDNGDDTYTPQFVSENTMPFFPCIQGTQLHDGLLFASSGISGTSQNVFIIDPETATIKHTVSLGTSGEIEGCAWANDEYLVVGQSPQTIRYRKVSFAEL